MSDEDARALTAFLISQKGGGKPEVGKEMNQLSVALLLGPDECLGTVLLAQN